MLAAELEPRELAAELGPQELAAKVERQGPGPVALLERQEPGPVALPDRPVAAAKLVVPAPGVVVAVMPGARALEVKLALAVGVKPVAQARAAAPVAAQATVVAAARPAQGERATLARMAAQDGAAA